jgi:hypothetical protein
LLNKEAKPNNKVEKINSPDIKPKIPDTKDKPIKISL